MQVNRSSADAALADAMARFETARTAYEEQFRGVDPLFSMGRCQQSAHNLVAARDALVASTRAAGDEVLVAQAERALARPVKFMGARVNVRSVREGPGQPPPIPAELVTTEAGAAATHSA